MSAPQGEFGIFGDQVFGPRDGFEPRAWQSECKECYQDLVESHRSRHAGNGLASAQHRFTIYAGTGSGKTKASAMIASFMLNAGLAKCVVVVCPNRSIKRKTRKDFAKNFGIDLVFAKNGFSARYADGIPPARQGYIVTYGHMMNDPEFHRKITSYGPTLVIFDEVHHLGDHKEKGWGDSATTAFENVPYVLCLTGTPYRSDNVLIPFVTYEATERGGLMRFLANPETWTGYTYSLGRSVADEVCRFPQFLWHGGVVQIRPPGSSGVFTVSFDDTNVNDYFCSARLRGAVLYGSTTRREMLTQALAECRKERRRVVIFLGGDTQGDETPTMDAKELLPSELLDLWITPDQFDIVTSDDEDAQKKIEEFGASDKWILISINMISEGTDIPELSAAIFLTSVTTKQSMIQRIGRCLRSRGENDTFKTALIFMFLDPACVEMASEILAEISVEQAIKKARKAAEGGGGGPTSKSRTEAIGIDGGEIERAQLGKNGWPIAKFRAMQARLEAAGLPAGMAETALKLTLLEIENVVDGTF